MSDKVNFTAMEHASRADYDLVFEHDAENMRGQAARVIEWLRMMDGDSPYQVSRLEHCLQTATRAQRDRADDETIVCALLHDIGDGLAPQNHDKMSAEVIRPFVRWDVAWTIEHHGIFQMLYYGHHYGWDRNAREQFKDHPVFDTCAEFCERWDQSSFDPDYPMEPLDTFEPMVREVFGRKAYSPEIIREGFVSSLTGNN